MQSGRQILHILQHNPKLDLNEAQIHNPEKNAASQKYHAITLPVNQPPTWGNNYLAVIPLIKTKQCSIIYIFHLTIFQSVQDQVYHLVRMISQGRQTGYPTEKSKIYTGFGLKHAARKCWNCEKKR